MKLHRLLPPLTLLLSTCAGPAVCEEVIEAWRGGSFSHPWGVSSDPGDGSCWVADTNNSAVVHLAVDGAELWRGSGFHDPHCVSVSPVDGTCWVGGVAAVFHIARNGSEVWQSPSWSSFADPRSVCVNAADGSCWVADTWHHEVVHLAQDGTELWRGGGFNYPWSVSVNPRDGSCWVADEGGSEVVHLAQDGGELWRGGGFDRPMSVAVSPVDSSCWVADTDNHALVHLAQDGTELWRGGGFSAPWSVSVNSVDGSCWVASLWSAEVTHVAEDGTELWREGGFDRPRSVSVNPVDGSCWVADSGNNQVVRLEIIGYEGPQFPDIMPHHWAFYEVEACADTGIVGGYDDGLYHPELTVTRDQMAVYIARALVAPSGEAALADYVPADPRNFPDAPPAGYGDDGTDPYWAYKHIEYCVENGVVQGYDDGNYHPDEQVTRAQMAVYVARALVAPTGEAGLADYVPADPRDFPDAPPTGYGDDGTDPYWAYTHIEYCVENGVVQGYQDGFYHPDEVVTRAQMAVYVARAFELLL